MSTPVTPPLLQSDLHGTARWLATEGPRTRSAEDLVLGLCERLNADGVPVCRFSAILQTLHPQLFGTAYFWQRGQGVTAAPRTRTNQPPSGEFLRSPFKPLLLEGVEFIRRRLTGPDVTLDYGILPDLIAQGLTDYVAMAIEFGDGRRNAITYATDAPGGFTDAQIGALRELRPLLTLVIELQVGQRIAETLLSTYLGSSAGQRVLAGQIKRGDGQRIQAVIWYCDLRDFTALSAELPPPQLFGALNDFFELIVEPLQQRGGEVLKFVGDAVLAIFRCGEAHPAQSPTPLFTDPRGSAIPAMPPSQSAEQAVAGALDAAAESFRRLTEINAQRESRGDVTLRFGLALHLGEVMYGNFGALERLDFTVIGPAVNLVSRLESMCKQLGHPLLLSESVARLSARPLRDLGEHTLRGVPQPLRVYTPDPPL